MFSFKSNYLKVKENQIDITVTVDVKNTEPQPDMLTKPADIIGYCFGFVCGDHHINEMLSSIKFDGLGERQVCQTCGKVTRLATVKRTAEAEWVARFGMWQQYTYFQPAWNKFEFIKFL